MFNFETVGRPGKTIANADALSRLSKLNLSPTSVTSAFLPLCFAEIQDQDKIVTAVKSWCQSGDNPPMASMFGRSSVLQCYWQQFETCGRRFVPAISTTRRIYTISTMLRSTKSEHSPEHSSSVARFTCVGTLRQQENF